MSGNQISQQIEELLYLTRRNLVNAARGLYPDTFHIKPSNLHYKLSDALVGSEKSTVLAFPREFGKTSYMHEAFIGWNILHRKYHYIMFIESTLQIAKDQLGNTKNAILSHPLLKDGIKIIKETQEQFFYTIGKERFYITCHGAGQQLRGKRFDRFRPDLIIIDDIETTEGVRSDEQRAKLKDWFFADVIPLGKEARFFYVGTMLHQDCLLSNLIAKPLSNAKTKEQWATFRFGVVDERGVPTWNEKYDLEWITNKRKEYISNGMVHRFNTEYMNVVQTAEDRMLDIKRIRFYNPEQLKVARKGGLNILTMVDPACSDRKGSDYTVIGTMGMDSDGNVWVLNIERKQLLHSEILDNIQQEYSKWNPRMVYIEAVQAQEYLYQDLKYGKNHGGYMIPVDKIDNKLVRLGKQRINIIEEVLSKQKLICPASATWILDLQEEMASFPRGRTDDILDVLSYFYLIARPPMRNRISVDDIMAETSSTIF